jgi:hypothetical protein
VTKEERDLLLAIRAAMSGSYTGDSCIAATALTKQFLSGRGFDGDGVQVEAVIYNHPYVLRAQAGQSRTEILADPSTHSVGIGFNGGIHVVYVGYREDEVAFVDLSLDQARRPLKGLPLGPYIATITKPAARKFMHGAPLTFVGPTKSIIGYRRVKKETFRRSPNWAERDADVRLEIINSAAKLLEEVRRE